MASKKVTYLGSQLVNPDEEINGFICDATNGLTYVPDADIEEGTQEAYATKEHIVTETNNPIWNQVDYKITRNVTASDEYSGIVTLAGIKPDGTETDIIDHTYSATSDTSETRKFDLLASACTGAINEKVHGGAAADTIDIDIPLIYEKYEDVDIQATWFDTDWSKRAAIPYDRTGGPTQSQQGRTNNYYTFIIPITYDADMNADFSDIRFTGPDGLTQLPHYLVSSTASTIALYLVALPYYMVTSSREKYAQSVAAPGSTPTISEPQYIYVYYGNSSAASVSDVTLNDEMIFYDEFDDASIDTTKWPTVSTTAGNSITEAGGNLTVKVNSGTTGNPYIISSELPRNIYNNGAYEILWQLSAISPLGSTYTATNVGTKLRVALDANNYYEVMCRYSTTGAYGSTTAGKYWATRRVVDGSATVDGYYGYVAAATTNMYVKCTIVPNYGSRQTYRHLIWKMSRNGYRWETIGYQTLETDLSGIYPKIHMEYLAGTSIAADSYFVVEGVWCYPTAEAGTEYMEDTFGNGRSDDRWYRYNTSGSVVTENSSSTLGTLTLGKSSAGYSRFQDGYIEAPMIYNAERMGNNAPTETVIYECKVDTLSTVSSGYNGAGFFITGDVTAPSTTETIYLNVVQNTNTNCSIAMRAISNGTNTITQDINSNIGTTIPAGGVWLRMILDKSSKQIHFCYSLDGVEWITGLSHRYPQDAPVSPSLWGSYLNNEYQFGLFCRNTASVTHNATISHFRAFSPPDLSFLTMKPNAEEALINYPIDPTSPGDTDKTLSFDVTGMIRNNAVYVRTKVPGGEYANSKVGYLSPEDSITLGPDGIDKYMGMRVIFDFGFSSTDTFNVSEINYLYEVI